MFVLLLGAGRDSKLFRETDGDVWGCGEFVVGNTCSSYVNIDIYRKTTENICFNFLFAYLLLFNERGQFHGILIGQNVQSFLYLFINSLRVS